MSAMQRPSSPSTSLAIASERQNERQRTRPQKGPIRGSAPDMGGELWRRRRSPGRAGRRLTCWLALAVRSDLPFQHTRRARSSLGLRSIGWGYVKAYEGLGGVSIFPPCELLPASQPLAAVHRGGGEAHAHPSYPSGSLRVPGAHAEPRSTLPDKAVFASRPPGAL